MFDGFSESLDKADVDVGFKECGADFLESGIELLEYGEFLVFGKGDTFSSIGEEPCRSLNAVVNRLPRSARTMVVV